MPMPARHLWSKIQKQLQGKPEAEQLRLLQSHLADLHDEWKGPYKELRDRLRRLVARLEGHESVRARGGQHDPFHVKRQGDAQVALVGVPNVGKSALVHALTGAATVVADYPFSTVQPVPGMLPCGSGALELIDTPPIVAGLADGEGAGRPLLHLLSLVDAVVLVIDLEGDVGAQIDLVHTELLAADVHIVPGPLATAYHPKGKEGIKFRGRALTREEESAARGILAQSHVEHAEISVRTGFHADCLRAQVEGEVLVPAVLLGTGEATPAALAALAEAGNGLAQLVADTRRPDTLAAVAAALCTTVGLLTVAVLERPTAESECTQHLVPLASDVAGVAEKAGGRPPKGARIWGPSAERSGQAVGLAHLIADGDRIFLQR